MTSHSFIKSCVVTCFWIGLLQITKQYTILLEWFQCCQILWWAPTCPTFKCSGKSPQITPQFSGPQGGGAVFPCGAASGPHPPRIHSG
ncbi:hypothetical protein QVD17_15526 [Tagetes erecta]|uniref:Uncharacterized protein n=1 Tax=Tagetes erecta TaxID=13708 RepID=A0AAD8KTH8_TARER|nr:hypothetical protein QVD17_15526 [Tagetes erecta]